jgi:outer membrane protein assembly factor BamA
MRTIARALSAVAFLLCVSIPFLHAQTYTPKAIHIDAPPGTDIAEPLRIAALPSGAPLTKQQIEATLQRIVDTGLFSEVSYTVNADALIIKITPSASNQLQPVHFANFVWWQPAELETLVESSVPAYHGKLPLAGTLTDQVKTALVSLLRTKGIDAAVEAMQSGSSADAVTLTITRPSILIGDVQLHNTLPALLPQLKALEQRIHGQDFDIAETTKTVQDSVNDIYENAGYLAVDTSAPTSSAPHKDLLNYAVDLSSTITPGAIYHVTNLYIHAQPPVSQADLEKAAVIKVGDPASPAALRLARGEMQLLYANQGYFDAKALITLHEDNEGHTIEYVCNFVPGDVYHFATIDTSALPPDQQATFAHAFTIAPGAIANTDLAAAVLRALKTLHASKPPAAIFNHDREHHTVNIVIKPAAAPAK